MFNIITIKEMQVKTIIRYHCTPVTVTKMSYSCTPNPGEEVEIRAHQA